MQLCGSLCILWHCLSLGLEWKLTFQSCGHCWVFQICWHIERSTFTASSFRIWKSSTRIPSPPLALSVVMLSKAHLTSHSRMSALDEWSHHRDYLGREDLLLYSSSVYSCYLFLISSASVRSIPFLPFIEPIFAWNVPLYFYYFVLIWLMHFMIYRFLYFSLSVSTIRKFSEFIQRQ